MKPTNVLSRSIWKLKRYFRLAIATSPSLSRSYYYHARDYDSSWRGLRPQTDIIVDAYPRSANSFFTRRLIVAQGGKKNFQMAHHVHSAGILVAGLKAGTPTVTIIRRPEDAVKSFAVFLSTDCGHIPSLTSVALSEYVTYYEKIMGAVEGIAVLRFENAIQNFHESAAAINKRFGLSLETGKDCENFEVEAEAAIRAAHHYYEDGKDDGILARNPLPNESKKKLGQVFLSEVQHVRYQPMLDRAIRVYEALQQHALKVEDK